MTDPGPELGGEPLIPIYFTAAELRRLDHQLEVVEAIRHGLNGYDDPVRMTPGWLRALVQRALNQSQVTA